MRPSLPSSRLPRWILVTLLAPGCVGAPPEPGGAAEGADGGSGAGDAAPPPCAATLGPEVSGDGLDNDCDGWLDEQRVCADGDAPFATLAAAIAATPSGGTLEVCAGSYAEALVVAGKSVTLVGAGAEVTFLDGSGAATPLTIGADGAVSLISFTVRNGRSPLWGGGIRCDDGALALTASALIDNRAADAGGGLYARNCELAIRTTRFAGNEGTAFGGGAALFDCRGSIGDSALVDNAADAGGGVFVIDGTVAIHDNDLLGNRGRVRGGALYQRGDGAITANRFLANHAGWTGGAIYLDHHAPMLVGNIVEGNDAVEEGGGLYLNESAAVITDSVIRDNQAGNDGGGVRVFTSNARFERNAIIGNRSGADGGGLKISHLPSVLVDNEIRDNDAAWSGGGLELDNDSSVIQGGQITGNHAGGNGGGIHASRAPWLGGTIAGVRIADNHAHHGGGVAVENNFQAFALRELTITGNTADQGGGLYARAAELRLSRTVLADNVAYDEGGGAYLAAGAPWLEACPCPPTAPPVTLAFVAFRGNTADAGAALWTSAPAVSVESSILDDHGAGAVTAAAGEAPLWRYNDSRPARFSGMPDPTGVDGNLAVDPGFLDAASGDYRLRADSPCVDAGDPGLVDDDGSRADMGRFAGPP